VPFPAGERDAAVLFALGERGSVAGERGSVAGERGSVAGERGAAAVFFAVGERGAAVFFAVDKRKCATSGWFYSVLVLVLTRARARARAFFCFTGGLNHLETSSSRKPVSSLSITDASPKTGRWWPDNFWSRP
jgi:hypothetical protein